MTTTDVRNERYLEKQIGCMAGFLHIFDRHQMSAGKRLRSAKRLPPSPVVDTPSESESSAPASPAVSREVGGKPRQRYSLPSPSPEHPNQSPVAELRSPLVAAANGAAELPPKSPLPFLVFGLKEAGKTSWKFCKETPRLSLDSRATTDAKGGLHPKEIRTCASVLSNRCESIASDSTTDDTQHHRSPSVIARLMGLEPLPSSSISETESQPELRRSASDSRVSRDLFHSRLIADGSDLHPKTFTESAILSNIVRDNPPLDAHYANPMNYFLKNGTKTEPPKGIFTSSPWRPPAYRKSFFDSGDFFPEPKQRVSIHGEIENRLNVRGTDEPSRDLETLKQILEALQLKGLLHSKKPSEQNQISQQNFIYGESSIIGGKISTLSTPASLSRKLVNDPSPLNSRNQSRSLRQNYSPTRENSPLVSPRRERKVQNSRSPNQTARNEGNAVGIGRRPNSLAKPKPLTVETHRRTNESATENRRASPVHSPKVHSRRTGPDPTVNSRSPRSKRATAPIHQKEKISNIAGAEDESSSISGSSSVTTSTDTEKSKTEEYKEGRNLLERCDKLLHSIAEMTATDMQPSPVSVLDSSFYKDESSTPSPVTTRRNLDFKDQLDGIEDELWSPSISPILSKCEEPTLDDSHFVYVSDVLRATHYFPDDVDIFLLLEKQQYLKGKDTSKASRLQRKLVFDTINEILDRNRRLPPWKAISWKNCNNVKPSLDEVWSEFQRIKAPEAAEDLFDVVCGVLKKDMERDYVTGWGDQPEQMSDSILDIERQIFKDLISDAIWDLSALASSRIATSSPSRITSRRKLVF